MAEKRNAADACSTRFITQRRGDSPFDFNAVGAGAPAADGSRVRGGVVGVRVLCRQGVGQAPICPAGGRGEGAPAVGWWWRSGGGAGGDEGY